MGQQYAKALRGDSSLQNNEFDDRLSQYMADKADQIGGLVFWPFTLLPAIASSTHLIGG
jgi:hypothetical protein